MNLSDISDATFAQRWMKYMPQGLNTKEQDDFVTKRVTEEMLNEIHAMLRTLTTRNEKDFCTWCDGTGRIRARPQKETA